MPELDVSPVSFKVVASPFSRVGVTHSSGARVILVPVPGGQGPPGPPGDGIVVFAETPAGDLDGSNVTFTTSQEFREETTAVYLNGLRETAYSETGSDEITLDDPPLPGDVLSIDYTIG